LFISDKFTFNISLFTFITTRTSIAQLV